MQNCPEVRGSKFVFGAVFPGATEQEDVLAKVSRLMEFHCSMLQVHDVWCHVV